MISSSSRLSGLAVAIACILSACSSPQGRSTNTRNMTPQEREAHQRRYGLRHGPEGIPLDGEEMNTEVESWHSVKAYTLRSTERCLAGITEVYLPAVTARWARSLRVLVDAPRHLSFHIEIYAADHPEI